MRIQTLTFLILLPALALPTLASAQPANHRPPQSIERSPRTRVELAILLDTSSSMDGLLAQAKARLWGLVNTIATARKNGRAPDLRVALYEYGKQSLPAREGYIRKVVGLTRDLDAISEALFALRTNGGDEFCGQAIDRAVRELEWSEGDHYRAIFIAGNEAFTQGPVSFRRAITRARRKGITVNTIHCGSARDAQTGQWNEAAQLAGGKGMNIDQNVAVATVVTPYDAKITRLGSKLNATYLAYGTVGRSRAARQKKLDASAAAAAPASAADRSVAKASGQYHADAWDLVDGLASGAVSLDDLGEAQMPAEFAGKARPEQRAIVARKARERKALQGQIQKLQRRRRTFIAKARKKEARVNSFDTAIEGAVTEQMSAVGFNFQ